MVTSLFFVYLTRRFFHVFFFADDLPLAMVMSPEDLTNDSSEVIVLDSKEKLMPLPKLEKPKVKPEGTFIINHAHVAMLFPRTKD